MKVTEHPVFLSSWRLNLTSFRSNINSVTKQNWTGFCQKLDIFFIKGILAIVEEIHEIVVIMCLAKQKKS